MPATEIKFYNSLTKSLETFEPMDPPVVTMYNCGPTVYDYAHIGNFKSFLFADVLRRFLELVGYDVRQVMNLTDVGHMTDDANADGGGQDKMAAAGERLAQAKKSGKLPEGTDLDPNDPYAIANFYGDAFIEDAKKLGIKVASEPSHLPRATDHIRQMQELIQTLIEKGHAYVASDRAVYFSVQSFPSYGRLSGNTLEDLRGGAGGRVNATNQAVKRHPADFLLWKPDNSHLMKWDSPWGIGYPGWHIECSAMARAVLGADVIDIHTGGEDNIFPHHECEIAQSCCATGKDRFAQFWMHGRHLMVEGQKMSKSKGNFYTVRQVIEGGFTGKPVDPAVLRYELIKSHYRSQSNITKQGLLDSASAVRRLRKIAAELTVIEQDKVPFESRVQVQDLKHPVLDEFIGCLSDDLNISGAIGSVFSFLKKDITKKDVSVVLALLQAVDSVLGVMEHDFHAKRVTTRMHWKEGGPLITSVDVTSDESHIRSKCKAIDQARKDKYYAAGDAIRAELEAAGYEVKTTKDGTVATKKLA